MIGRSNGLGENAKNAISCRGPGPARKKTDVPGIPVVERRMHRWVDMLTSPVAAARAAVASGAWIKSKHDMYLIRGSVGA